MSSTEIRSAVEDAAGVLRLAPALVARDWLPPGRRLGLDPADYDQGERGFYCERWLGSTTHADNRVGPEDEGISSVVRADGSHVATLADAVEQEPELIMGADYAATHRGLGRLAKIFDYGARIPFHIHPPADQAALVGRNSKDEAYYYPPGVDLGAHPETFYGLHPWLAREENHERLVPYLERWDDDAILEHSVAYLQVPEQGFMVHSGILHAPGTALTIELQEDADTMSMFQALNAGTVISKEMLFKDVSAHDRAALGERALLRWVDWEANTDPEFYEKRILTPHVYREEPGVEEAWLFAGSDKFSGKRVRLAPGARVTDTERGVYNLLVWSGRATVAGVPVSATVGDDELLLTHDAATAPHEIVNTGTEPMELIKFFGPDINPTIPAGIAR